MNRAAPECSNLSDDVTRIRAAQVDEDASWSRGQPAKLKYLQIGGLDSGVAWYLWTQTDPPPVLQCYSYFAKGGPKKRSVFDT
jgi:hypothetical protein